MCTGLGSYLVDNTHSLKTFLKNRKSKLEQYIKELNRWEVYCRDLEEIIEKLKELEDPDIDEWTKARILQELAENGGKYNSLWEVQDAINVLRGFLAEIQGFLFQLLCKRGVRGNGNDKASI